MRNLFLAIFAIAGLGTTALAAPITATEGDFGPGAILISFDGLTGGEEITTQFAGLGVTFSGGLFASTTDLLPFNAPGSVVAVNYVGGVCGGLCGNITLTFSAPVIRVGAQAVSNLNDDVNLIVPGGSIAYPTFSPDIFIGLEDLDGFTTLTIDSLGTANGAFGINDLLIEFADTQVVPEPATYGIVSVGLLALAALRRKHARTTV